MQNEYDSRRVNFWTIDEATKPIDGFSDFEQKPVMAVFSRFRDLAQFSIERKHSTLTLHVWGSEATLRLIKKELDEIDLEAEFPEEPDDMRHLSVSWS